MSKREAVTLRTGVVERLRRRVQALAFAYLYRFGGRIYDPLTRLLFGSAWDRWRRMVLPFVVDGPVLDLGCGTGALVAAIALEGHGIIGIDREPSMLARASRRAGSRGRLVRADASHLPISAGSFRTCVATFPSAFILAPETLDEIARVLKPDGIFVVVLSGQTTQNAWWRMPIQVFLRVFYGPRMTRATPETSVLAHPLFDGEWRWIAMDQDRALVWFARRKDVPDRGRA